VMAYDVERVILCLPNQRHHSDELPAVLDDFLFPQNA